MVRKARGEKAGVGVGLCGDYADSGRETQEQMTVQNTGVGNSMYEKYELPIRFTEEQRKKYAEWGIKKGKVLMPMAAVTILIDLLTVLWVVGRVWLIRESDPIWFQIICQNDGIGEISSTIAIILTFLILKPIDLILDKIWHRPEGTEWLEVGLTENGVTVKRTYRAGDAGTGVDNAVGRSCCGEITVFETHPLIQMDEYLDAEKNAVRVQGVWLEIGENTRENIYTPQQQKRWLDQPEGKSGSINSVKKLQKIIKGYAAALEEKEKERAWLMEQ